MSKFVSKTAQELRKLFIFSILMSLMIAIVGIVMYAMPDLSERIVGIVTGVAFILTALVAIYKFFKRDGARLYKYNLLFGIAFAILGLIIILNPYSVSSFITICLGIYLIVLGGLKMTYGVWFKVGNDSSWFITLVIGLMLMIFGVLLIVNPFASSFTLTQIVGIFLLISSVLDITDTIMLLRRSEKVLQIFW